MKCPAGLLFILGVLLLAACASSATPAPPPTPLPTWQEFRSGDGRFRVMLPGQSVTGQVPLPILGNGIDLQGPQTRYQGMLFFVAQADAPAEVLAADDPTVFHKTCLDAARTIFKGHLISTTPLELNGHIGQEYLMEVPDGLKTPGGGVLLVTYADLSPNMPPFDPAEFLAEYRDGLLRVSGGTLKHNESIQLGDYPGLDYTVVLPKSTQNPQGIVDQARVYLVDGRVYWLDFVTRFSMAEAPEVNQFFDSFQVVPRDK